jgi:hypothetical protein
MPSTSLLVIGHREGLSWILGSERMAFARSGTAARSLACDDKLFLYTTRACFLNPSRNVSRVIGHATVTSTVSALSSPVNIAGRTFPHGCTIKVDSLAPLGEGVPLRNLVDKLDAFSKNPQSWSLWLRRTLLPLSSHDASLIARHLASVAQAPEEVLEPYLKWLPQRVDT